MGAYSYLGDIDKLVKEKKISGRIYSPGSGGNITENFRNIPSGLNGHSDYREMPS